MEESQINRVEKGLDMLRKMTSWSNQQAALIVEDLDAVFWKSLDKQKFGQTYCDFGGPELMISILGQLEKGGMFKVKGAWETAFVIYNSLCNISESSAEFSAALGEKGMIGLCTQNVVKYREKMSLKDIETLVRISLSVLCNLSIMPANRHVFREEGVAEKLQPLLSGDPYHKTLCMIILAYIVEEGQEESVAEKGGETTEYLVRILKDARKSPDKRYKGLCDMEIARALGRLAVHDQNKHKILDAGGLPVLVKMLKDKSTDSQEAAANTLWNLAFSEDIRRKLGDDEDFMDTLRNLTKSPASNVVDAANGVLWVITRTTTDKEDQAVTKAGSADEIKAGAKSEGEHIMISYQWGSQPVVLKIRDALKVAGYKVWVDVDHMHGSTLQAMAEAVENACIVLMCISERYKESPNCRTEAEYAFQLRRSIIPLMMEEYYQPDGWLGIILGSKLYMDFSGRLNVDEEMGKLQREVQTHAKKANVGAGNGAPDASGVKAVARNLSRGMSAQHKSQDWTKEQVKDWLLQNELERWRPALLKFDGKLLHNLCKLRQEAPEFFYASIRDDEGLSKLAEIFKFTSALDALMNE